MGSGNPGGVGERGVGGRGLFSLANWLTFGVRLLAGKMARIGGGGGGVLWWRANWLKGVGRGVGGVINGLKSG